MEIIPYTSVDGIRTFKDSFIKGLYNKIIEHGHGHIFDNSRIDSANDFLYVMKTNSSLFILHLNKEPAAIAWLNRVETKTARCHWCTVKDISTRDAIRLGKYFLRYIMSIKANNEYLLNVITGYTPISNIKAIRFAKLIGMTIVGRIPYLSWNEKKGKSETCVISYYVRGKDHEDL